MAVCQNCKTGIMQKPLDEHPSYLLCPNCNAIELVYSPQEYQDELHTVPYNWIYNGRTDEWELRTQIVGVFGGYGSGKSRSTLSEMLIRALENPNGIGLFTAPTLQQLKRTTIKTWFDEVCPPPLVEYYNKTDGEIKLINGFTFYTIPSDDEEKLRSINAGLIHMEEASGIKRTIYDQLLTRTRHKNVANRMVCVCSNPDMGWIREVFVDNERRKDRAHVEHGKWNPYRFCYVWLTEYNQFLPPDFIEVNSDGKPEWWIKRYLGKASDTKDPLDMFDQSEGMVFPKFTSALTTSYEYANKHGLEIDNLGNVKIPKHWVRFTNLDHGLVA